MSTLTTSPRPVGCSTPTMTDTAAVIVVAGFGQATSLASGRCVTTVVAATFATTDTTHNPYNRRSQNNGHADPLCYFIPYIGHLKFFFNSLFS